MHDVYFRDQEIYLAIISYTYLVINVWLVVLLIWSLNYYVHES